MTAPAWHTAPQLEPARDALLEAYRFSLLLARRRAQRQQEPSEAQPEQPEPDQAPTEAQP